MLPEEIEMLGETGTNVVINPLSNTKLKSGIPPILGLQEAGVSLGIGCDNCSCSDAQNMFQAMKLFCLMVAVSNHEPSPAQSGAAFAAATTGGAHAIRRDDLGKIEVGAKADISLMDLTDPSYIPLNSATRQLVYTEGGRGVKTVIIDGKVIIQDGRLQTMDEEALIAQIMEVVPAVPERLCRDKSPGRRHETLPGRSASSHLGRRCRDRPHLPRHPARQRATFLAYQLVVLSGVILRNSETRVPS